MGGDHGPHVTVPAALEFRRSHADVDIVLVGLSDAIEAELALHGAAPDGGLRVRHAAQVVAMDEAPAKALRLKKDSSMRVAVNLVKAGAAHACVSAGNTGALMAISRFVLKTLPAIDRPAIVGGVPNQRGGYTYILDLGANVDCTPEQLMQFGVMGAMLVAAVDHKEHPSVGLLNIGVEDMKGNDSVKQAAELLRASGLNFHGNVEADDIYKGTVDVVVCDGFVGNIVLKMFEGVADAAKTLAKDAYAARLRYKLGLMLLSQGLRRVRELTDWQAYGGAPILGFDRLVIKAHGRSNARAVRNALRVATKTVERALVPKIEEGLRAAADLR